MYEYLLEHLITNDQVESNLRRTASEGLISRLNRRQLVTLALKYFGVDKEGNYTEDKEKIDAYRCPYSGKLITNPKNAHLDHIIPVANSGGSVLFNCIPILDTINSSKNATPLLGWWANKPEYFSPTRLVRLTDYLMEAYSLAFEEYTPEELEDSYNDYFGEESERVGDLTQDKRKQAEIYQESIAISNTSYLQFITDIILCLKANNIDCTNYEAKLKELENKGVFDNVKQFELIEQTLQKVFKNILGDDNGYITYSLNIDINKLLKSFKSNDIISELEQRLIYINNLLKTNNLSLLDYLKNLQDIDDINLLYFDISTLTNNQTVSFIESIKIGHDTKILMIIEMLNLARNEEEIESIIKQGSTERFKTYKKDTNGKYMVDKDGNYIVAKEYSEIGRFWNNKDKILPLIYDEEKYQSLQEKLDSYYMMTFSGQNSEEGKSRRIQVFIEMLNLTRNEKEIDAIIKTGSTEKFKTYKKDENGRYIVDEDGNYIVAKEYDKIGNFWSNNKKIIFPLIYGEEKYQSLQEKLDSYYMMTLSGQQSEEGKNRRTQVLIEMLNIARNEKEIEAIIKTGSTEKFKTYKKDTNGRYIVDEDGNYIVAKEYDEIGQFWIYNKNKILPLIYGEEKYQSLQEKLDNYYMMTYSGQKSEEGKNKRIQIFIEMLNQTKDVDEFSKIIHQRTTEKFKTYKKNENGNYVVAKEYDKLGAFWQSNKDKNIIPHLFFADKYANPEYDNARNNIMWYLNNNRKKRNLPEFKNINEYIDTLDKTKKETKILIKLRDELLAKKMELMEENQELNNELNNSTRRAM